MVNSIDSKHKKIILIVENDDRISSFLFKYLADSGYRVLVTNDAETIKNRTFCPDLILLDISEAQEPNFEVSHYLKYDLNKGEPIPTILMVSQLETRDQIDNCQFNTIDCVLKPINQQALVARIESQFKLRDLRKSLTRQEEEAKILFQLSEKIRQSRSLELVLREITVDIQKFLNCDRVIINSYTENYPALTAQSSGIDISPIIPETYSNFLAEIYGKNTTEYRQYQQGSIQVIEDINQHYSESSVKAYFNQIGIKSQLSIPICIHQLNSEHLQTFPFENNLASQGLSSLWGWLIIHQCNQPKTCQQSEIKFLQHVVSQIAIAIRESFFTEQQQQINQQLKQLELYDPLTRVYNRRYLDQQIDLEWRRLQRIPSPVSMIICDVDYFEAYKNIYGEQAGNLCLQNVARIMTQAIRRPADFVSLYSEEKFAIILPHTPLQGAQNIAEAIQAMVSQLKVVGVIVGLFMIKIFLS